MHILGIVAELFVSGLGAISGLFTQHSFKLLLIVLLLGVAGLLYVAFMGS
ncbi:MAG: hypothetical protein AAF564_13585 [Bacteroidota bacterium]